MTRLRLPVSVLTGLLISLALLWLMQALISGSNTATARNESDRLIEFVRLKQETETRFKERVLPEKPRVSKTLPRPEMKLTNKVKPAAPTLRFDSNFDLPVDFAGGPYLGAVGPAELDRDFVPIARTPPQYPYQAARRGVEGWVRVSFTITETGSVEDVVVLESEPAGVFDKAAVRAIYKWKFKPRVVNGKAVAGRAEQLVDFDLNR